MGLKRIIFIEALRAVNKELVGLYWDIGRMIVERQADAAHGSTIAEKLAADLRQEFPGTAGFSRRNVFYIREFYLLYRNETKVQPMVAQTGWILIGDRRRSRFLCPP